MSHPGNKSIVELLIGPAGSGKTHACLNAIRKELKQRPDGAPLLLLAPKQATFQMEHALLSDPDLHGYSRLQILSFDRLAEFILSECGMGARGLLSEEGRIMVMRALLNQIRGQLRLFHAAAKLPGLAQELSRVIREFQQNRTSPTRLLELAESEHLPTRIRYKLHDIALLYQDYQSWIDNKQLHDPDCLLDMAADALRTLGRSNHASIPFWLGGLWMDGFAALTPQERQLLTLLAPLSKKTTLAFCADSFPEQQREVFSIWLPTHQTLRHCLHDFASLEEVVVKRTVLKRTPQYGRFTSDLMLGYLEENWTRPAPFEGNGSPKPQSDDQLQQGLYESNQAPQKQSIAITACQSREAEAIHAARNILKHVRDGGMRFHQMAVLVRSLPHYQEVVRHVFDRYEIPCFIDRRESIAHHPLIELTRSAIRLPAYGWAHEDWFAYLKSGFTPLPTDAIDDLENASIERGWRGTRWWQPLKGPDKLVERFEPIREKLLLPIKRFLGLPPKSQSLGNLRPWNGLQLANACRALWKAHGVESILQNWDTDTDETSTLSMHTGFHMRVLESLETWLSNIELAFAETPLPIREWIPILEAGLNHLTVGVLPPAIDQVLVGAIDRSRNPDLKATFLLGLNESIFPAKPSVPLILDERERLRLEEEGVSIGNRYRTQLATERFLGYIGCTRSTEWLSLSYALNGEDGQALLPSALIQHVKRLFPNLETASFNETIPLDETLHERELLLSPEFWTWKNGSSGKDIQSILPLLKNEQSVAFVSKESNTDQAPELDAIIARTLYSDTPESPVLRTSVSRIEAFAECPFRYFVQSGLKAEERMAFELDARRLGSFQHAALESFHLAVKEEGLTWHDLTSNQARELMSQIVRQTMAIFHDGLMEDKPVNRITATALGHGLETFIGVVVDWMKQYAFEPSGVEVAFGGKEPKLPAWELNLSDNAKMVFNGIIDRVDLLPLKDGSVMGIVVDYKSGKKKPDATLSWNGIQLQLPVYLNVLRHPGMAKAFDVESVQAVGAFFTTLRARYEGKSSRQDALNENVAEDAVRKAYQHVGCFNLDALPWMDQREGASTGDQFQYQLNKDGSPRKTHWHVMPPAKFEHFMEHAAQLLSGFGDRILNGDISAEPFLHRNETPCERCDFATVCRIDPWTQAWRNLEKASYGEAPKQES